MKIPYLDLDGIDVQVGNVDVVDVQPFGGSSRMSGRAAIAELVVPAHESGLNNATDATLRNLLGSVDLRSRGIGRQRFSNGHLDGDRMTRKHSDGRGRSMLLANLSKFVDQFADRLLVSGDNASDAVIVAGLRQYRAGANQAGKRSVMGAWSEVLDEEPGKR